MFTLSIRTDNAVFEEDAAYEVGRILAEISEVLMVRGTDGKSQTIRDANGNDVGRYKLEV